MEGSCLPCGSHTQTHSPQLRMASRLYVGHIPRLCETPLTCLVFSCSFACTCSHMKKNDDLVGFSEYIRIGRIEKVELLEGKTLTAVRYLLGSGLPHSVDI